jgi:anaerobic selenocysteine-containing dehydrogenase
MNAVGAQNFIRAPSKNTMLGMLAPSALARSSTEESLSTAHVAVPSYAGGMVSAVRSICRICTAQCGIVVSVDGDRVVGIRGDSEHPHSNGYTCPKGRALASFHHHESRLLQPRRRGEEVSWEECLDDLGAGIATIRSTFGPQAVAVYSSMGAAFDSAGLLTDRRLFAMLQSPRYSALMLDCGPLLRAASMIAGSAWEMNPTWIPEEPSPSVVLFIGCNPVVSHGYQTNLPDALTRIRNFQRGGGSVWVLDPRRTETATLADQHVAVRPDSDAYVLAWLARELLVDGADEGELRGFCRPDDVDRLRAAVAPFDITTAARRTGVPTEQLESLLRAIRRSGKVAILTGTGVQFAPHALITEWLRLVIGIITGSVDREGGMWVPPGFLSRFEARTWVHAAEDGSDAPGPLSRPDLRQLLGEQPAVALADEIEAGNLRALVIAGGSPLRACPEPDRLRAALRTLPVLAVTDVVENELTAMATHVLPVAAMFERSDVTRNKVHSAFAPALLPLPGDVRPSWWVWAQLGRRLGVDVLGGVPLEDCSDDALNSQVLSDAREPAELFFARGTHGVFHPRMWGWLHDHALPEGRWRIAPPPLIDRLNELAAESHEGARQMLFVSQRVVRAHNAVRYTTSADQHRDPTVLNIHPVDAAANAISEGSAVRVRNGTRTITASASLNDRVAPGTVSLTHGGTAPNVADLIDPSADPLTGQPVFSAFPVAVEAMVPTADSRR